MNRPKLHLICNAHLDPVWQWRWQEGCAEALATFRNAIELLADDDELIFNHNEALLYRWVKQYDPELFKQIQYWVRQGRWFISGGWYLQPDVNLPIIESLIRHISAGREFFRTHFQVQPEVAYNFDSFGHSGGLPQILVQSGYKMYIHARPSAAELELPMDLYRWRGVDGSEILCYRIDIGFYHTEFDNIEQKLAEGVERALNLHRDVPVFWGIGNHGGGATRADLEKISAFRKNEHRIEISHSTPDRFYQAIKDLAPDLPIVEGDLQRVFTGCYTSLARLKRQALKSSAQLLQAETLRAATWWLFDQEYPEQALVNTWQDHLFNDFHDILPGSCIEPAEKDALELYGQVAESTRRLSFAAAVAFNRHIEKSVYIPVITMNTVPGLKTLPIELECMISYRPKWSGIWHLRLYDLKGREITCQEEQPEALLPFNGWRRKLSFMAPMPDVGAAHWYLEAIEGEKNDSVAASALKFTPGKTGLVEQMEDDAGQNLLAGPLLLPLVVADDGDSWGTDRWQYRDRVGQFQPDAEGAQIIASGPIRTISERTLTFQHSKIILHTIAYSQWPVLEFRLRIHWHEELRRLKLSIPTIFKSGHLLCEVPGGIINRPADGQEHVHGRWLMVTETTNNNRSAIGVVHNGQHGFDFKDGELRLSVLRSAAYCHEQGFNLAALPARKYMDQGVHEIRLLITLGAADHLRNLLPGLADWLNAPPIALAHLPFGATRTNKINASGPGMESDFSEFFTLHPPNVRLLACKRCRDGQALIIRVQESSGSGSEMTLTMAHPRITIILRLKPLEIKTLRIEKSGRWSEVSLIDEQ